MREQTRKHFHDQVFYSPAEIADRLKLKIHLVWELLRTGEIKAHRVRNQYRITEDQINEFLNAKK